MSDGVLRLPLDARDRDSLLRYADRMRVLPGAGEEERLRESVLRIVRQREREYRRRQRGTHAPRRFGL